MITPRSDSSTAESTAHASLVSVLETSRLCRDVTLSNIAQRASANRSSCRSLFRAHSRRQYLVEFIQQLRKLRTEKLMRFTQAASLAERRIVEIVWLDADGRGDVVADEFEPGALFGSEHNILGDVSFDPLDEALIDRLGKRLKNLLAFEREADEGDEVGEAAGLGSSFDFLRRDGGEGVPEAVFGPGGVLFAELFLQLFEHRFGEPVTIRPAVEKLERGDLGFVLFDVVAERSDDLLGVLRRLLRRAGEEHAVAGDHVDHLLAGLMDLDQELAQRGIARQRRDGFLHQFRLRSLQVFVRRLIVWIFAFLGFGFDIVGIGRGEQSLRDLAKRLALRGTAHFSSKRFVEALLQSHEPSGEAFEHFRFAIAEGDGVEQLVERHRALFLQRAGVGQIAVRTRRRRR